MKKLLGLFLILTVQATAFAGGADGSSWGEGHSGPVSMQTETERAQVRYCIDLSATSKKQNVEGTNGVIRSVEQELNVQLVSEGSCDADSNPNAIQVVPLTGRTSAEVMQLRDSLVRSILEN